ncbi:MAG: VIT1/CCC1 transporter family protein [Pirellulaceae bacterium]
MKLDPEQLKLEHSPDKIRQRLSEAKRPDYLADFVYGAIDGTVTTFAVVSGVAGADLSSSVLIILGFANLVGDGFSMAAGNYLATRTDAQLNHRRRQHEAAQIDAYPEGEREEIREIYRRKGFQGDDLERAVAIITADKSRWIDAMIMDELGMQLETRSPLKAAAATMLAFFVVGSIPLFAFVTEAIFPGMISRPYACSTILTGIAFFLVGAVKSRFVEQRWLWSGLETLTLGGLAAVFAYTVGYALAFLIRN